MFLVVILCLFIVGIFYRRFSTQRDKQVLRNYFRSKNCELLVCAYSPYSRMEEFGWRAYIYTVTYQNSKGETLSTDCYIDRGGAVKIIGDLPMQAARQYGYEDQF